MRPSGEADASTANYLGHTMETNRLDWNGFQARNDRPHSDMPRMPGEVTVIVRQVYEGFTKAPAFPIPDIDPGLERALTCSCIAPHQARGFTSPGMLLGTS